MAMCINIRKDMTCRAADKGFTLIELVAVIVLLAILTVTVAPRFLDRGGFSEYAVRDQIISAARMAQQRAMYDQEAGSCYRLEVSGALFGVQSRANTYGFIGPDDSWRSGIAIENGVTVAGGLPVRVYFDGLGNALDSTADCAGSPLDQARITINGSSSLGVCINAVGFIRAC